MSTPPPEQWPLTAASTELLRATNAWGEYPIRRVSEGIVVGPAIKELVFRGILRIVRIEKRSLRRDKVLVAPAPGYGPEAGPLQDDEPAIAQLPPPLNGVAREMRRRSPWPMDLKYMARYCASPSNLGWFVREEHKARGLVIGRSTPAGWEWMRTQEGDRYAAAAEAWLHELRQLSWTTQHDPARAGQIVASAGPLVLLERTALPAVASLSHWRQGAIHQGYADPLPVFASLSVAGGASFDALGSVGGMAGSVIDSVGSGADVFSSLESVSSSIDASVSSGDGGGGFFDSGGGGGGGDSGGGGGDSGGGGGDSGGGSSG